MEGRSERIGVPKAGRDRRARGPNADNEGITTEASAPHWVVTKSSGHAW
jgi:hypothetical protein